MEDSTRNLATVILASYAALVSTTVLIWDYYKWRISKRPQLVITASAGALLIGSDSSAKHIVINVANVGEKAVTLNTILYEFYESKPGRFRRRLPDSQGFFPSLIRNSALTNFKLPHKLEVGEEFQFVFPEDERITKLAADGFFYVVAKDSSTRDSKKAVRVRLMVKGSPKR